ncbi:alpha/beta hydrolase [Flavobacterium sp.]|uniref:alpha/beta fold hydrolase n=1 Tax=Flavobacterium sp. TaxID=239 RepID=UPI00286AB251|nr:alpha/beta hydrolase [Flavobacterium sp.]
MKIPKSILLAAKISQFISPKLTTLFASKLFTTPVKHKMPKRELEMDVNSRQEKLLVPKINKSITIYHYGNGDKKILLVHGWSGRGTQLVKFADELLKLGYSTISFDAPAHGKSGSKTTIMPEFIASVFEMEKQFGPFEAAIGHSLGGMTLMNAVKRGLNIKKAVIIGSGDKIKDVLIEFVKSMHFNENVAEKMKVYFENKFGESLETYAASEAAKSVMIPTLVIHDENDYEVPIFCGKNIFKNLPNGEMIITKRLGHRKILGDKEVIEKTINFIQK